jgi:hypothetical protein
VTLADRLAVLLRDNPGIAFCDGCVALRLEASLMEAREAMRALEGQPGYVTGVAGCSECLRSKTVIVGGLRT